MDGWLGLKSQQKALEGLTADLTLKSFLINTSWTLFIFFLLWLGATVANVAFGAANRLIHVMLQYKPVLVMCAMSLGIVMYKVKKRLPVLYGAAAIVFGAALCARAVYTWPLTPGAPLPGFTDYAASWLALGSGVYAIARGTEDFRKGQKKDQKPGTIA